MNKTILMAAVAALAITAPAQAEKGGKHGGQDQAAQAAQQEQQARGGGNGGHQQQRAAPAAGPAAPAIRAARSPRASGLPAAAVRAARPPASGRFPAAAVRAARPPAERQVFQQRGIGQRVDNRARFQDRIIQRQARQIELHKACVSNRFGPSVLPGPIASSARRARPSSAAGLRSSASRWATAPSSSSLSSSGRPSALLWRSNASTGAPPRFDNRATQRALFDGNRSERWNSRPEASVGQRLNVTTASNYAPVNQDWYGDYAAQRYSSLYSSTPDRFYDYNYNDGYLYQARSQRPGDRTVPALGRSLRGRPDAARPATRATTSPTAIAASITTRPIISTATATARSTASIPTRR